MFENLNFDADLRSGLLAAEAVGTEHGMPAKMDPEDKIIATSLTSQVERYIIALIRREQLKPGDAIPSEMQLVEQLGLSRSVVREAFRSLAALGIVEIRSGRKPRVKTFDSSVLELLLNFAASTAQVSLEQILEALGLTRLRRRFPARLSGGERQRVVLGRALLSDAEIILADEPCARLDRRQSLEIMGLLKECAGTWNRTVLMATHDLDLAQICHQILVLRDGQIFPW